MTRIALSQIMDAEAVDLHLGELKAAFAAEGPIAIECGAVTQIGMIGLQLLASAARTEIVRGVGLSLTTNEFIEAAAKLAGLNDMIFGIRTYMMDDPA